jgi:hypothetical protein
VYALPPDRLRDLIAESRERLVALGERMGDALDFSWAGSLERHLEVWNACARLFLRDFTDSRSRGRDDYVSGALPRLPFADGQFALTLCSFLVFTFPGHLDPLDSILELVRVTTGEVRLGPLQDAVGDPYPDLDALRARLLRRGVVAEERPIGYSVNPRQRTMLVCRRSG